MLAGIIAVPIAPPNLATADKDIARFKYLAETTGAKLVFSDKNYMLYTRLYAAKSYIGLGKKIDWPEGLTWVEGEQITSSPELFDEKLIEKVDCDNVAVLQFSSGSTDDPKGVCLTHRNLLHNVDLMQNEIGLGQDDIIAFWVPQFHDLGLIGGFLNTIRGGCKSVVMSPLTFLQKPESWLQMITNYQATFTAAPNFAYELATRKCDPNSIKNLNFSSLRGAFNGAEPVRWSTLNSFTNTFSPAGFKLSMFKCLYGLAEHCAYAVGFQNLNDEPTVINIDPITLREGRVKIQNNTDNHQANHIVSTGIPNLKMGVEIRVVDQETRQLCSPNTIGEVWVSSPSVGKGYYGKDDLSEKTFRSKLNNDDHGNRINDNGSFLRTGDLGFLYNGELFITGRQKDVIIINGKNHYPQDIELTVQGCHNVIRPGCVCAINHSDAESGTDSLIILIEIRQQKEVKQELLQEICDCIVRVVPGNHGLSCRRIVILKPHSIPKTTSGKLQRAKSKEMLLSGSMDKKILISFGEQDPAFEVNSNSNISTSEEEIDDDSEDDENLKLSSIQEKITWHVHLISKVASKIPKNKLNINANLITDYGFDSLAAVQLTASMKQSFGVEVAPALLYDVHTIADLSDHIHKLLNKKSQKKIRKIRIITSNIQKNGLTIEDDGKEAPSIVPLAPKNVINKHNPPLYCIHPLLGNVASYIFLAKNLGINRPVYGVQAPSDVGDDIKVIAKRYARAIQLHQQNHPYYLCGYSYGGLVAWEMAKLLQEHGVKVGGLYLIDAPSPLQKCVRSLSNGEEPHIIWRDDIEQLLNDVDSQWMVRAENEDPTKIEMFKKQIGTLISSMYSYTSDTTIETVQKFPIHYWRAKDYAGKTSKLLLDHPSFHEPNFGWEHYYKGDITFHRPIPGHHYNVLREETAGRLARELDTNMPIQSKRSSSMDLRPLMLEKVATQPRGSAPNSSSSGKSGSSTFPLFKENKTGMISRIINTQIPLPVALIGMIICMFFYFF
ncbi:hypothetical protein C1645_423296 [Glomus cerebriforme]|uniref:Carrier domain-containing protein n=1 Tax=Glomus cerebriforme TaxID=658196 RepID=A0A397SNP0_9GLOM|nr:hypothetical protein C1645_423296 [Glomus cerebriforme]